MSTTTPNIAIFGLPFAYLFALLPQIYAQNLIKSATSRPWDNANPSSAAYKGSLSKDIPAPLYARFERAVAAHKNGMENLPLIFTAVILGRLANLAPATMDGITAAYLVSRIVYNALYIRVENVTFSYARTGVWMVGVVLCWVMIGMAGRALIY